MSIGDTFTEQEIANLVQQSRKDLGYNKPENKNKQLPCCYRDAAHMIEVKTGCTATNIKMDTEKRMHIQGYLHKKGYNGNAQALPITNAQTSSIVIEGIYSPDTCRVGKAFCDMILERKQNRELGSRMGCESVTNACRVKTILEKRL